MPTEVNTGNINWISFEGTVLGGVYPLEQFISADETTASFLTRTGGEKSASAVLTLVKADGEAAERQIQIWQVVKRWVHPNLRPIWGTGRTNIEGQDFAYAVMEAADETLAGVLRDRPLTPAEAGEVLASLVGALGHLHAHRMVHGSVSPEQVIAVGETVKLSTEGVRKLGWAAPLQMTPAKHMAPERADENATPAADIWCLGATLVEILTQQSCRKDCLTEAAQLPAPFDKVALSCLQREPEARGALAQLLALYEGKSVEAPSTRLPVMGDMEVPVSRQDSASLPEPDLQTELRSPQDPPKAPTPVTPVVMEVPEPAPGPISNAETEFLPIIPRYIPPSPTADVPAAEQKKEVQASPIAVRRAWILVALALVIVLLVVWLLRPKATNPQVATTVPQTAPKQPVQGRTMELPSAERKTNAPAAITPNAPPPAVASSPVEQSKVAGPAKNGDIWRVVLYTYNRSQEAEKRAATIKRKHPDLDPQVFSPSGEGKSPYLVVLGGSTDRNEVAQLRRKALQAGLPRDAYLQNYDR